MKYLYVTLRVVLAVLLLVPVLGLPDIGVRCQALLLEAGIFLCFGGVCDACWTGVSAAVVALSLWQIVRMVRAFGVDGKAE